MIHLLIDHQKYISQFLNRNQFSNALEKLKILKLQFYLGKNIYLSTNLRIVRNLDIIIHIRTY